MAREIKDLNHVEDAVSVGESGQVVRCRGDVVKAHLQNMAFATRQAVCRPLKINPSMSALTHLVAVYVPRDWGLQAM